MKLMGKSKYGVAKTLAGVETIQALIMLRFRADKNFDNRILRVLLRDLRQAITRSPPLEFG